MEEDVALTAPSPVKMPGFYVGLNTRRSHRWMFGLAQSKSD